MPRQSENSKPGRTDASKRALASAVEKSPSAEIAAILKHYGITTVPRAVYEWGGFRYTNAHDAIAAAKRGDPA